MKKNYKELLEKVRLRSNPEAKMFKANVIMNESLNIPYSDVNEYVKLAMMGVPKEYTDISKNAAQMVISTLKKNHGNEVDFKFQGSVETNTHIWSENDVDIVQITNKSNTIDRDGLDKALKEEYRFTPTEYKNLKRHADSFSSYQGDQLSDLGVLRKKTEDVLKNAYQEVNIKKPKAVCVMMQNPKRNIDVVTAVYYKPVSFMKSNEGYKKGIQVYDKDLDKKLPAEFPFWSIERIQIRNIEVSGRFKKMIRFMKNVKFDTASSLGRKLNISSFDINAICYNIKPATYNTTHYLGLVGVLYNEIMMLIVNEDYRNALKSIDGQEFIFRGKDASKLQDLLILKDEIDSILGDIEQQTKLVG